MESSDAAPKRQQRGLRRIESILDAAEDVIAQHGYDGATTNQIALRAGISPGSLYQYFSNKSEVVEALARRHVTDYLGAGAGGGTESASALVDRSVSELVERLVHQLITFNLDHPAAKFLLAGTDLSPQLAGAARALHVALHDQVEGLVAELAPRRRPDDVRRAAVLTIQILSGSLPSVLAAGSEDRELLVAELELALGGYWSVLAASTAQPTAEI